MRSSNVARYEALVLAVASGQAVAEWCRVTNTARSTAATWEKLPDFRGDVTRARRQIMDRVLGRTIRLAEVAVAKLGSLMNSKAEGTQLRAAVHLSTYLISIHGFVELEERIAEVERRLDERTEDATVNDRFEGHPSRKAPRRGAWPANGTA